MKWIKEKVLPGLVILAIVNAVYAYGDVKQLKSDMRDLKTIVSTVGDIKNFMCILALKTTDEKLKEKICAGLISNK